MFIAHKRWKGKKKLEEVKKKTCTNKLKGKNVQIAFKKHQKVNCEIIS